MAIGLITGVASFQRYSSNLEPTIMTQLPLPLPWTHPPSSHTHLHDVVANGEVFSPRGAGYCYSSLASLQPLLVPHVLLIQAQHHLSVVLAQRKDVLQKGEGGHCNMTINYNLASIPNGNFIHKRNNALYVSLSK